MSHTRHTKSFSMVRTGRVVHAKSIEEHSFPFDASDMAVMHGSFPKLAEMGGVPGLAGALRSNAKTGIALDEVDSGFAKRKAIFGQNIIPKPPLKSFFAHCAEQLEDPMLIVLIIAGIVSVAVGIVDDPHEGWVEGLAILLAVVIVTVVGSVNNLQQEKEFRRLDDSKSEEYYQVLRGGKSFRVPQSEVVVGDLVELSAGDEIPADGVFVDGDDPACNEAKMTGETKDIEKDYFNPFVMAGTEIRRGQLAMLVVAVGINTSYGRIMASLVKPVEQTPLQVKLEKVAALVGYIGGGVAITMFIALMIRWGVENPDDGSAVLEFFIVCVTIVVVAVPEGLPLAVTISLAYSMKKMVADQNLVRILSACETMGNATTICSDKTGTLTTNEMTVMKGWVAGTFYEEANKAPKLSSVVLETLEYGLVVNSKAKEELDEDSQQKKWQGNQTEVALCKWMGKYGVDIDKSRDKHVVMKNYPFDSMKKNSSVILRYKNKYRRYYKGAGEQLFARSTLVVGNENDVTDIAGCKAEIAGAIDRMTGTGLRTIAVSYQEFPDLNKDPKDPMKYLDPDEDIPMVFVGVVGIKDPLRPESQESVRQCQRAGVVVRMVTGDHPATAKFIARECGILTSDKHVVMTGDEFRKLMAGSKAEAEKKIPYLRVLARSKPEDKQTLVRWLKDHGHVVAATGDGTNDAPALKEAHVGIAMNIVGTAVAKAAAEILILDDNFASVVKAIMWGRSVFDNIRKFVQFQLTVNVTALAIALIGAFQNLLPLKTVQLLWVNLIMDTMAALALGTEIPTMALLDRRPYSRDAPLISRVMWRNILGQGLYQVVVLTVLLFIGHDIFNIEKNGEEHFTLIFNSFVFMQIFNEINSRKVNGENNVFANFFDNSIFSWILVVTIVFQVIMVEFFGAFAETTGQSAAEWACAVLLGLFSIPLGFIIRLFKMDTTDGMISVPEDTFEGADLVDERMESVDSSAV